MAGFYNGCTASPVSISKSVTVEDERRCRGKRKRSFAGIIEHDMYETLIDGEVTRIPRWELSGLTVAAAFRSFRSFRSLLLLPGDALLNIFPEEPNKPLHRQRRCVAERAHCVPLYAFTHFD